MLPEEKYTHNLKIYMKYHIPTIAKLHTTIQSTPVQLYFMPSLYSSLHHITPIQVTHTFIKSQYSHIIGTCFKHHVLLKGDFNTVSSFPPHPRTKFSIC